MYCLDTNIWSYLMRRESVALLARLDRYPTRLICLSEMVRAELLFGAARHPRRREYETRIEKMLAPYRKLPFEGDCVAHYVDIRLALEKAGTPIGPNDLIIAACARAANAVLVTHNTREFRRVPGLKVEDWQEK